MRYPKRSVAVIFAAFALTSAVAQAADRNPVREFWDDVMDPQHIDRFERSADRISESIFHAIDDITLFQTDGESFGTELSVHRRVFDNENIMNTWTVADRFTVDGKVPLVAETGGSGLGFWIGANAGIEIINIRQTSPVNYAQIPSVTERKESIVKSSWYEEFSANNSSKEGQWVYRVNEAGNKVLSFLRRDPEHNARYSDLPGLVVLPVKLPLNLEGYSRMENGEIMSYLGQGSIELGGSIGWNADPTGISAVADLGLSYSTFLKGTFRISVLRENEQFARVKVTRAETIGRNGTVGSTGKPTLLDGVLVVKNLQRQLKVVPFEFKMSKTFEKSFDVGYRFDLSTEEGREAYEQAVLGRFGDADELAARQASAVRKLFSGTTNTDTQTTSGGLRLGFVFKERAQASFSNIEAVITFPDGTRRVLTALSESDRGWRLFWGVYEKFTNRFTVNLDLDQIEQGDAGNAMTLSMEGKIDDSDTDSGEYLDYLLEMEDAIGKPDVFKRIPPEKFGHRVNLGRSNFYYRVGLNHQQIQKFIQTPKHAMWPALEAAFGVPAGTWSNVAVRFGYRMSTLGIEVLNVPLYVAGLNIREGSKLWHAEKIRRRWAKLKRISDPREQAEALGRMFFDRLFGYELARLVRQVLNGEEVSYFVTGNVRGIGRVTDQGGTWLNQDDVASRIEREKGFDRQGPHAPDKTPEAQVSDFTVTAPDQDHVRIHFRLKTQPKALFFELSSKRWWRPLSNATLATMFIPNAGEFVEGENVILLDRRDTQGAWSAFVEKLQPGDRYSLRMAINVDGLHWGQVAEDAFRTPENP